MLEKALVDRFVSLNLQVNEENLICGICQDSEDLITKENVMITESCGHLFHKNCIQEWLNSGNNTDNTELFCPICNTQQKVKTGNNPKIYQQTKINTSIVNNHIKEMLLELLPEEKVKDDFDVESRFSESQAIAFSKIKNNESVAILGEGGTGKSMLLKAAEEYNQNKVDYKKMYLCATTGVAAYNIGGMTIHSFMGFGTGEADINILIKKINRQKTVVDKLKSEHILVIDEISMMSADLFEKINLIYQHFRKVKQFFGGIQLIVTGDFLQTECVFVNKSYNTYNSYQKMDRRILIESDIFNRIFNKKKGNIIVLRQNFRQLNDPGFLELLSRVRVNKYTKEDINCLEEKIRNFEDEYQHKIESGITPIHLVVSNAKAQVINESKLKAIKSETYHFNARFSSSGENQEIIENLKKELVSQLKVRGLLELSLKVNAKVMLTKNLDSSMGLVNGSIGTITKLYNDSVCVLFDNGLTQTIGLNTWKLELFDCSVTVTQIPFILAYALTIHKSLSLTLECAIMDLADCFCNHLVYVALSRVKALDGILLRTFNKRKITVNQKIIDYLDENSFT